MSDDEREEDEFQPVIEEGDEEEEDYAEGSVEGTDADTDTDRDASSKLVAHCGPGITRMFDAVPRF